jgi:ubiquinone/menaquinone biosynthesis C-methylase UbiE
VRDRRKQIVADGYDSIAELYAEWGRGSLGSVRERYVSLLRSRLEAGAKIIDLGCGTGAHATNQLAESFDTIGVDISQRSIELARHTAPSAAWVVADMASVAFRAESCDGVLALYSLIHVPREEHADVLRAIARWLRPGGWLVLTMGAGDGGESEGRFLDTDMYWSGYDAVTNVRLVEDAGFDVAVAAEEVEDEDGVPVSHLWIVATKVADSRR